MQPTDPTKRDPQPGGLQILRRPGPIYPVNRDQLAFTLIVAGAKPSSVSSGPQTAIWLKPYTTFGQNLNIEGPGSFFCSKIPKEPGMELGED